MDAGTECTTHPKVCTLFEHNKHLQLENHITDESIERPFLESTKAPHVPEMHWRNIRKRGCYKLDSFVGRHFKHFKN
eukprot:scaffold122766_cov18-Tisochrysis_lutea.AAC.4